MITEPPQGPESEALTRSVEHPLAEVVPGPPLPGPVARSAASRTRIALGLALAADAVQIVFIPLFGEGIVSPLNDGLDLVIGLILVRLLGWHWAFLPSFVAELVPGLDLFPSWTTAVWFATRSRPKTP
jgi:hypothetical protein